VAFLGLYSSAQHLYIIIASKYSWEAITEFI